MALMLCLMNLNKLGEPPKDPGTRTDLLHVKEMLDNGASLSDVANEHFGDFLRYGRGMREYLQVNRKPRNWQTTLIVYFGPPGTGKTQRCVQEAGEDAYWLPQPHNGGGVWFDGYDGQENVVIDEFYGWIPRSLMQRMICSAPLLVQTKGGMVPFLAKRIWITSNQKPSEWWKIGLGAMERRMVPPVGEVYHVTEALYDICDPLVSLTIEELSPPHYIPLLTP